MSALDVDAKSFIVLYILPVLLILVLLVKVAPKFINLYVHKVYLQYLHSLHRHRNELLKQVKVEEESIKILELRLNQGENLDFYPEHCEIFVLTTTEEQAMTALTSKCCNYAKVEPRLLNLKDFEDEEIDVVVGTSALCRCQDQTKLLNEIYRVLAPNGKYIFIEHTTAKPLNPLSYIVKELASTLAVFWFPDMCDLNSEPVERLRQVGFTKLNIREVIIDSPVKMLTLIRNHVVGVAVK